MGLLSNDALNEIANTPTRQPVAQPAQPQAQPTPTTAAPTVVPAQHLQPTQPEYQFITPEQQTARFGGPVGSLPYYENKSALSFLPRDLMSIFGVDLPPQETWDKLSRTTQTQLAGGGVIKSIIQGIVNLPRAVSRGAVSTALTVAAPFESLAKGKIATATELGQQPVRSFPWIGETPTMYQTQAEAEKGGMGPLMSRIYAGSITGLDSIVTGDLFKLAIGSFQPRGKLAPGEQLRTTEPVRQSIEPNRSTRVQPAGSTNEYYTLPVTDAKKFGGSASDTHWKVTASGDGSSELSLVRSVSSKKVGDVVQTPMGSRIVQQGDFGPEIKVSSEVIQNGERRSATLSKDFDQESILVESRPKKGFENAPVDQKQIDTVFSIASKNQIPGEMLSGITKTIIGKTAVGELTQSEFSQLAQVLAKFGEKYAPDLQYGPIGHIYSKMAPQRNLFDYVEERYGLPVKSEIYNPIEEGTRLARVVEQPLQAEFGDLWGKYSGGKFLEERRLVDSYVRGDKAVLDANTAISDATKAELRDVAGKVSEFFNKYGEALNVEKEAYIGNYLPRIADIGGVYLKYKDLSKTTAIEDFFAKHKRTGSVAPALDDPLALGQIYIHQGSKALHLKGTLDRTAEFRKGLPDDIRNSVESYIQEKLGYAGQAEKFIDSFVPSLNRRMGWDLPSDFSRQFSNYALSSFYAGMLSQPATWIRQFAQLPTFVYGRLGPQFFPQAMGKALTRAGREEAAKGGYLLDMALPYGEELTKEFTTVGRVANAYKKTTQAIISPNSWADNFSRVVAFHQSKMIWDDAIARFNSGKFRWGQVESAIDINAMPLADRNIIRQKLVAGDIDGAFNTYVSNIIDDTSFPYRKGSSARITYGLGGKMATGLLTYSIEAANVLERYARTGQWDKFLRIAAGAHATNETLKDDLGFDFGRTLALYKQFNNAISPFMQVAISTAEGIQALADNNRQLINEKKGEIVRTLTSSLPAGIEIKNVNRFLKSYRQGVNENGEYGIYDNTGKLQYSGDFSELFWGALLGFPTLKREGDRNLYNQLKNESYSYKQKQDQINELMRQGNYDAADRLISQYGIFPSSGFETSRVIPRSERFFQSLPGPLKAELVDQVYPQ